MKIFHPASKLLPALAAAVVLSAFGATAAHAHMSGATGAGWAEGLAHPFSGLDHVLAMVAVGLWAAQMKYPAAWLLPLAFPAVMAAGAVLAALGFAVPGVEAGIAGSVMLLGLLVALTARPSLAVAATVVGFFALFHGHAHGSELPMTADPWLYGAGFVIATVILNGIGLVFGSAARRPVGRPLVRLAGAAVSTAGLAIIAGV